MKRNNIILKITIILFIVFALFNTHSDASTINDINMDVYIDSNGSASITEVWTGYFNNGTECYKPYSDLGNSEIYNFSVTDKSGTNYKTLSNWIVDSSFDNKAYKCGLHKINNGVELCWGISKYGYNTYTLKYTISNFVTKYTDSSGIYFNFLNLEQGGFKANITIHSDYKFDSTNSQIWAFGYSGNINFIDGNIVLASNGSLNSSDYIVALVKLDNNLFNTNNKSYKSFEDVYNSAVSTVIDTPKSNYPTRILIKSLLPFALYLSIILLLFVFIKKSKRSSSSTTPLVRPLDLGEKIHKNEIGYFRDIPCDGNLYCAYWLILKYNILKENNCKNAIISATFLRYIQKDYIKIVESKKGLFGSRYTLDLTNLYNIQSINELDRHFIHILKQASGKNNILEAKEFENWCRHNFSTINYWFENIEKYEESYLFQKALLKETIQNSKHKTIITKHVTPELRKKAIELLGLKKFLLDYSLIASRESIEVNLWEEYLIFAQLLGIARTVKEQLKKLYPDFNKVSKINTDYALDYTRNLATNINNIVAYEVINHKKNLPRASNSSVSSGSYSSYDSNYSTGSGGNSYESGGTSAGGSSGGGIR